MAKNKIAPRPILYVLAKEEYSALEVARIIKRIALRYDLDIETQPSIAVRNQRNQMNKSKSKTLKR